MNRCSCQSPPAGADGGAWRSGSPAAGLPQPGMPDGVLALYTLRSRTALLQYLLSQAGAPSAMPCSQSAAPVQSGRTTRSSRSTTYLPAASPAASRDGSIFRFGHFSGTIRLWRDDHDAEGSRIPYGAFRRPGRAPRCAVALLQLWPARPLCRSFSTHSPTQVRLDDQS